jgi:glycosyltransferase involved in cell wall biosynthesis
MRDGRARVLLVEENEDGTAGGSHRCLADIATHLDPRLYEPVALFYEQNRVAEELRSRGVEVHVWDRLRSTERRRVPRGPRALRRLMVLTQVPPRRAFLRSAGIDLVHLNNNPMLGCWTWLPAAKLSRIPCISHCRGFIGRQPSGLTRIMLAQYDRVVAISDGVAASLLAMHVARRRVLRIYDGVDLARVRAAASSDPGSVRSDLGVQPDTFLAVMVAHFREWKGQHVLVRALAALSTTLRERLVVLFIGAPQAHNDRYYQRVKAEAEGLGLSHSVRFLGDRQDAWRIMAAADVVVHASTSPEPFGLVIVEGMALGRAVVASRLGGGAEIVVEGSGVLFDPQRPQDLADVLDRLADPALRARLGEGGRARALRFDIASTIRAIEALYSDVLGRGREDSRVRAAGQDSSRNP